MGKVTPNSAAANPAIASLLQSTRPAGRVAELGSLAVAMTLIPTAAKDRLPKAFSYPLGAQAISVALEGIPLLDDARFWFSWRDEYWVSEWRQKIQALGQVTLLEVADSFVSHGREVRVYAVPSDFSVSARERLTAEFPRVRRALVAAGDSLGSSRVTVTLDLAEAANKSLQGTPGSSCASISTLATRRPRAER